MAAAIIRDGDAQRALLAGDVDVARAALGDEVAGSPPAAYAQAIAALIADDDAAAQSWVSRMRGGSDAFDRAADAIAGLAARDPTAYAAALEAIVRDFEQRAEHLTGVAIADTALMLELFAAPRGITAGVQSPLLPTPRG